MIVVNVVESPVSCSFAAAVRVRPPERVWYKLAAADVIVRLSAEMRNRSPLPAVCTVRSLALSVMLRGEDESNWMSDEILPAKLRVWTVPEPR